MELNSDLIMQFGLMQKLSTGNSILDAILVMLLPFLFSHILPHLQEFVSKWVLKARRTSATVTREITFTFKPNTYFDYDGDIPPNHKLQTAILMHLNTLPGFQDSLLTADVKLVKVPKRKEQQEGNASTMSDDGSSSSDSDYYWYPDMELEDFQLQVMPPMDETVTLEPGLTFCRSQKTATTGDGATKADEFTVTFTLQGSSVAQIDGFIAAAYESYREVIKGQKPQAGEEKRYLYLPVLSGAEGAKETDFTFRCYPLTDGKDFTNFFHPEKDAILQLVDAFANKTGKFAIKGYPNKLGFLLHGPPGTGKTTFLRALASHTKRSIINIPLSRIRTNQQLMSLMMDQQVRVEGADYCMPLPHSKVIYVCEDVDAASHVVQKRGVQDPLAVALSSLNRVPANAAEWATAGPAVAQPAGAAAAPQTATVSKQTGAGGKADVQEASTATATEPATTKYASAVGCAKLFIESGADTLNLAGLLNVLDGVVDTPGRLLVLSTNHPEVLDPALIRPGRINRKVYMGHIALREALQLVCHYFGDLTPQQQDNFQSVWLDGCVSPAALEALCAECEDVDSLLQGVTVLVQHSDAAVASASAGACADSTDAAGAASGSQLSHDQQTSQEVPDQDSSSGSSGSNGGNGSSGSNGTNGSSAGGCDVATEPEGLGAPAGNAAVSAESPCGSIQGCSGDSDCRVFIDAAGCSKLGGDHLLRWAVS